MNKYIYGMHVGSVNDQWGLDAAQLMLLENVPGWIVFTEAIGHEPNSFRGGDYRPYSDQGMKVIARLNNGYAPHGTIPLPAYYDDFAQRCTNYVQFSQGCNVWAIGNEPNHSQERPGSVPISAAEYAECYKKCRAAIHAVQPDAIVAIAGVAPWNVETGDWLAYFDAVLALAGPIDAIVLHTYTHGADPALITSTEDMATMPSRLYHFQAYRQFMERIPDRLRNVPVYITETNQDDAWLDANNGWVQEAYEEIERWNAAGGQQVQCLALYRWDGDQWRISDKPNVQEGFREALRKGYTWRESGGGDVGTWNELFSQGCESGNFPAQGGESHLQVVDNFTVHWRHKGEGDFPRPELKPKDREDGQPEVYEGRYAQSGFYISATGQFALVSDPIVVEPGKPVRGEAMYMHVFGDHRGGGSRCGVVDGDGPFLGGPQWPKDGVDPFSDSSIAWGEWQSTYRGLPDRSWVKVESGEVTPTQAYVRLIVQFNADTASSGSNGHWDNFLLEQFSESTPDQPPDGEVAAELMQIAADLTVMGAELTGYAQQLYAIAERVDNPCPPEATTLAVDIQSKADRLVGVLGGS
jgi:hypothetical protein